MSVLLLAGPKLPEVELWAHWRQLPTLPYTLSRTNMGTYLELFTFKDVAIRTARLSWSAADNSVQTAGSELGLKKGFDLSIWYPMTISVILKMSSTPR